MGIGLLIAAVTGDRIFPSPLSDGDPRASACCPRPTLDLSGEERLLLDM